MLHSSAKNKNKKGSPLKKAEGMKAQAKEMMMERTDEQGEMQEVPDCRWWEQEWEKSRRPCFLCLSDLGGTSRFLWGHSHHFSTWQNKCEASNKYLLTSSLLPPSSTKGKVKWKSQSESCSVVSNSLQSHELYSPWNSPGQNIGMGSLSLLQGNLLNPGIESSSPTLRADSLPAEPQEKPKSKLSL